MLIYKYHADTRELLGEDLADESPLEPGVFLIPAHATTERPPVPVPGKIRCFIAGLWVYQEPSGQILDPEFEPSIVQVAQSILEEIQREKVRRMNGGFSHNGTLFDSDLAARTAYLELALKLGQSPGYSTPWKASAGAWITMDATLFADLQPAYEAHIQACFAWQAGKEQEVAAAVESGDKEALKAISEVMG